MTKMNKMNHLAPTYPVMIIDKHVCVLLYLDYYVLRSANIHHTAILPSITPETIRLNLYHFKRVSHTPGHASGWVCSLAFSLIYLSFDSSFCHITKMGKKNALKVQHKQRKYTNIARILKQCEN